MAVSSSEHSHSHQRCEHHSHSSFSNKKFQKVMAMLEKLSLVALAVFAAYTSPRLFFPFFGVGFLLGTYLYWNTKQKPSDTNEGEGGCSQGFIEQLTGVRLPPPLGLIANLAITICHIDHHETVFVPLIGLNIGMWCGKLFGQRISLCCHQFTHYSAAEAA